jgi:hypothetical protein
MRVSLGWTVVGVLGLAGCTCGEPPALRGTVVDPWGAPVAGAAVTMPGVAQAATSAGDGAYALPLKQGKYEIAATRDGFVAGKRDVAVPDVDDDVKVDALTLFPIPSAEGFHVVGPQGYLPLAPVAVQRKGTATAAFHGVLSAGEIEAPGENFRVVFQTSQRADELARLGLSLHRLTFQESMPVATPDGDVQADVHLWTDAGKVDVSRVPMQGDRTWMFSADRLPSGTYAFVHSDLLDPNNASFEALPEAARKIHPFVVP